MLGIILTIITCIIFHVIISIIILCIGFHCHSLVKLCPVVR